MTSSIGTQNIKMCCYLSEPERHERVFFTMLYEAKIYSVLLYIKH